MEFVCEDLRQFGVELVPPSSPAFGSMLADVRSRLDHPVAGSAPLREDMRDHIYDEDRETSAILVNRSSSGIAAIQQVWTLQEAEDARFPELPRVRTSASGPGASSSIILPYGRSPKNMKLFGYWHVILPGSKRYIAPDGAVLGDNSDVRPPGSDEVWTGGVIKWGGSSKTTRRRPLERVTLTLDGVFFVDGGFAGPNQRGLWEEVTSSADTHRQLTRLAQMGRVRGASTQQILAEIERIAPASERPPIPPPPQQRTNADGFRTRSLQQLGFEITNYRKRQGDEATVQMIIDWGRVAVPQFRKLA